MKYLIFVLMFSSPFVTFSQGYESKFADLAKPDSSTDLFEPASINFNSTPGDISQSNAVITITGVPAGEINNIKLMTADVAPKKITTPQPDANGNLVFQVKDQMGSAKGKFQLFYKEQSKGKYQFKILPAKSGDPAKNTGTKTITDYVGVLANANFVGNNKFLSNVTPIVTLGVIVPLSEKGWEKKKKVAGKEVKRARKFVWSLDINPYLGGQIDTKDSVSFVPGLMLPGRAGLIFNNYLTWSGEKVQFTFMPLGFGLKLIPGIKDSTTIIFQHNFRTGIALGYSDVFLIGMQYTHGFHNTTSESQRFYKTVFSNGATDIDYLTISGQFYVKTDDDKKNFLYLEWRGLSSKKRYAAFTNNSILTIGYRSNLSLTHIFSASTGKNFNHPSNF